MSVYYHAMKTFLLLFTALVVYKLQHNIDRSASSRSRLHISSIIRMRKHQYSSWIGFHPFKIFIFDQTPWKNAHHIYTSYS